MIAKIPVLAWQMVTWSGHLYQPTARPTLCWRCRGRRRRGPCLCLFRWAMAWSADLYGVGNGRYAARN